MNKKLFAPCFIAFLMCIYMIGMTGLVIFNSPHFFMDWIVIGIFLYLICQMIDVTVERIREIKGGNEDDLSEY